MHQINVQKSIAVSLTLAVVLLTACSSGHTPEVAETWDEPDSRLQSSVETPLVEAISRFGAGLIRPDFDPNSTAILQDRLKRAIQNFGDYPEDPESILWVARNTAAFWRYRDAIYILSDGLSDNADDPRFYRFRGHYHLNTRAFDAAIEDLRMAVSLLGTWSGQVEPDEISGLVYEPSVTYGFTSWYHLGLAYYMQGQFSRSRDAFVRARAIATNTDSQIQALDWLVLTHIRQGAESADLAQYRTSLPSADTLTDARSNSMRLRMLLYPDVDVDVPSDLSISEQLNVEYAHALRFQLEGRVDSAKAVYQRIIDSNYWASFSYIAAESELYRLGRD